MEIKDILSELITVATATLNERGCPENFDLEDFINAIEDYYEELDEIGEFVYLDDEEGYDFGEENEGLIIKIKVMSTKRNWDRVLTDEQISSIHDQLVVLFRDDAEVLAEMVLNNYLAEDKNMLWANMVELIEQAEKGELLSIDQINMILKEDNDNNNI